MAYPGKVGVRKITKNGEARYKITISRQDLDGGRFASQLPKGVNVTHAEVTSSPDQNGHYRADIQDASLGIGDAGILTGKGPNRTAAARAAVEAHRSALTPKPECRMCDNPAVKRIRLEWVPLDLSGARSSDVDVCASCYNSKREEFEGDPENIGPARLTVLRSY